MSIENSGHDRDLAVQIDYLHEILHTNIIADEILKRARELAMPNWYLGAGCIAQTVWNFLHIFDPGFGIKDYDLVYYDSSNTSPESEADYDARARQMFHDLEAPVDVTNEARVHLWYEQRYGYSIRPYISVEHAISTWPTTATSVGVRIGTDGLLRVCTPFGLSDLLALIVRPNKTQISRAIYQKKIDRWMRLWPRLRILSWDQ